MKRYVSWLWLPYMVGLFVLGLASSPVFAQSATSTPTVYPTFLPSATAILYDFPDVFSCPSGMPSGYGTVTPDVFWEASCGSCLHTPFATSTSVTSTPVPTVTGTPPTPTASPTAVPDWLQCPPTNNGFLCSDLGVNHVFVTFIPVDGGWYLPGGISAGLYVANGGHTVYARYYQPAGQWDKQGTAAMERWSDYGINSGPYTRVDNIVGASPCYGGSWLCGTITEGVDIMFESYIINAPVNNLLSMGVWRRNVTHSHFHNITMEVKGSPFVAATSTPPASYCDAITGSEEGGQAQPDPGLSWGGVYLGYNACVDIGGWHFSILGIEVDVPLVRVCMQDVSFANVVLFGMSFSLDAVAYVLGGAWVIRRLLTS